MSEEELHERQTNEAIRDARLAARGNGTWAVVHGLVAITLAIREASIRLSEAIRHK